MENKQTSPHLHGILRGADAEDLFLAPNADGRVELEVVLLAVELSVVRTDAVASADERLIARRTDKAMRMVILAVCLDDLVRDGRQALCAHVRERRRDKVLLAE